MELLYNKTSNLIKIKQIRNKISIKEAKVIAPYPKNIMQTTLIYNFNYKIFKATEIPDMISIKINTSSNQYNNKELIIITTMKEIYQVIQHFQI